MKVSTRILICAFAMQAAMVVAGPQSDQFEKALDVLKAKDFKTAHSLFSRVQNSPDETRAYKLARFHQAVCKMNQKDYWAAEVAYRSFLTEFLKSDKNEAVELIPRACYELGMVQEALGREGEAMENYLKGSSFIPASDPYTPACKKRLNELRGSFASYSKQQNEVQDVDQGEVDSQIAEAIELAKSYNNSVKKDEILLKSMKKANCYRHVVMFLNATSNRGTKDLMCIHGASVCATTKEVVALAKVASQRPNIDQVCFAGVKTCKTVDDFVLLASAATAPISDNNAHDRILLMGTACCKSVEEVARLADLATNHAKTDEICLRGLGLIKSLADAKKLADAAAYRPVKDKILDSYQKKAMGVSASVAAAEPSAPTMRLDQRTVGRVQAFLSQAKSGGDIESARKMLQPSDYEFGVVKEMLKNVELQSGFDQMHGGR